MPPIQYLSIIFAQNFNAMARRRGKDIYEIEAQLERIRSLQSELIGRQLKGSPRTVLMNAPSGVSTAFGEKSRYMKARDIVKDYKNNILKYNGINKQVKSADERIIGDIFKKRVGVSMQEADDATRKANLRSIQNQKYSNNAYQGLAVG